MAALVSALAAEEYKEAARLQARLQAETSYLDELLEALTRPAFAPDANQAGMGSERAWRAQQQQRSVLTGYAPHVAYGRGCHAQPLRSLRRPSAAA